MANPLMIAAKGKGLLPMLARGWTIASRYGLNQEKMDHALGTLTDILCQYGCSATIPFTASALGLQPFLAKKYASEGLELAVHGMQHIDHSMLSLEEQVRHLGLARSIFEKLGLPVNGFRCPYLRWNEDTLIALAECGFGYDSSQALAWDVADGKETDTYRRALEFYRAQPAHSLPALPGWSGDLVRIPYCLPDDEALVDRLHLTSAGAMAKIWLAILDATYQSGEVFTLGLHPERIHLCKQALAQVLEKAVSLSPRVWIARLDEIVRWYKDLGQSTFDYRKDGEGVVSIQITAPAGATVLVRQVQVQAVSQPWAADYRSISERAFTVQSSRLPFIGLSQQTPVSLERFLRHQGYLVERSGDAQADAEAYACYLDRAAFSGQDERPLLEILEEKYIPLVRLSRWPHGARSVLTITGDVDALTLWDYGRRIFYR